ncbi:hypothetical protein AALP_AA7G166800 [Arabis alpina]|uniref:Uncharacterized protein n=1 Tax=Arabis alpina TaxID=50452 RepID=A0A087GIJ3_ARAAL|nr:hypothetical protein AALP_AA7G166800 [Arabis alpina]
MSRISRKSDSIGGIWYDTYEIDDIDEIVILFDASIVNKMAINIFSLGPLRTFIKKIMN